jgi:hypothetical protein
VGNARNDVLIAEALAAYPFLFFNSVHTVRNFPLAGSRIGDSCALSTFTEGKP